MKKIKKVTFIFIFLLFSIGTGLFSQGVKETNESNSGNIIYDNKIPYNIKHLKRFDTPYVILVEKNSQKLFLYSISDKIQVLNTYQCSTGEVNGDKEESGDLRTPEGIYYFDKIKEDEELPEKYGIRAFVMNYPNKFDKLKNRDGFGIWLHATNEPERARLPYSTQGCVIVNNGDILELSNYIALNRTPIIVEETIKYLDIEKIASNESEIQSFMNMWVENWENRDINKYIENYSKDFYSQKKNLKRWRKYKKRLFNKYSWINIEISDISILEKDNDYIVNFRQKFISDQFSDYGKKRLYITKNDGKLKIVAEEWEEEESLLAEVEEAVSDGR